MIGRRTLVSAAIALPLGACASAEPTLYTLAETQGMARPGAPRRVVLREIGLPRYLDRPQIVRGSADYQLSIAQNDWWGEPLGRMIGRVLVGDLSARLPGSTIVPETGAIATQQADATLEINILEFAGDKSGNIRLTAQIAVLRDQRERALRSIDIAAPMPTPDSKGQVAGMSKALGELADAAADLLRA